MNVAQYVDGLDLLTTYPRAVRALARRSEGELLASRWISGIKKGRLVYTNLCWRVQNGNSGLSAVPRMGFRNEKRTDANPLSRYTTFEPPPSGFDPLTAPPTQLRKHGFPRRPDLDKEPQLYALWRKAFSRPMSVIKAEIGSTLETCPPTGNPPWAGAEVNPGPAEALNMVYGQWIQPSVVPPENPTGCMAVGIWVGIGGDDRVGSPQQLIQAGTQARLLSDGSIDYSCFTQWFDQPGDQAKPIDNFPLEPGDHVEFLVCTPSPDHGFVSIRNFTKGLATNVGVTPPRPGLSSEGRTAEWTVEGNGRQLMDFFSVTFGQCLCSSPSRTFDLSTATTNLIGGSGSSALANGYLLLSNAAMVVWNDFGP